MTTLQQHYRERRVFHDIDGEHGMGKSRVLSHASLEVQLAE